MFILHVENVLVGKRLGVEANAASCILGQRLGRVQIVAPGDPDVQDTVLGREPGEIRSTGAEAGLVAFRVVKQEFAGNEREMLDVHARPLRCLMVSIRCPGSRSYIVG